jgi:hypothetical protein
MIIDMTMNDMIKIDLMNIDMIEKGMIKMDIIGNESKIYDPINLVVVNVVAIIYVLVKCRADQDIGVLFEIVFHDEMLMKYLKIQELINTNISMKQIFFQH